ncbi:putative cardiolipin synthase YbhO [Betaproteobacteria bacterium MOLA814]|jgi:cardiolipin synthase|nr:putative cardiolipin synthase YbhO [Betaproteobacteria bacterium MOLA814]
MSTDSHENLKNQGGHRLRLLAGGHDLFPAMIVAINAAHTSVRLETYIFDFAGAALEVAHALEDAAQRGLQVCVVLDGVGTPHVPAWWQQRWQQAGVQWQHHVPLGRWGLLVPSRWRRLHRKLCVVDERIAFCGGINVMDDYLDVTLGPLLQARLDFAVQVQGPLVSHILSVMQVEWRRLPRQGLWHGPPMKAALAVQARVGVAVRGAAQFIKQAGRHKPTAQPYAFETDTAEVRVSQARLVLRDNIRHRADIEWAYIDAITCANSSVLIAMAYFLPGARLRRVMRAAVARGVSVTVIVQGRYENFMQFRAARPIYTRLIAAGVRVAHYEPSALHAKVAVVDGQWATVGSSNLDPLSLLLAKEANIVINDAVFAGDLQQRLSAIVAHSIPVDVSMNAVTGWPRLWERLLDNFAFALMRAALWLTGHSY